MTSTSALVCDGCGQASSAEHVARRLKRLEWTTRYRPVHIHTLFLGAFSPRDDKDFLYAPGGEFQGEAALLLEALGISTAGKAAEAVHAEFQRAGLFLTHILECPLEDGENLQTALKKRLPAVAARVRRSLKPKRVMAVTEAVTPVVEDILAMDLGCPVLLDNGKPFRLDAHLRENAVARFRKALAATTAD